MKLLIPWYRFPPFEKDRIGGVEVVIWELAGELERQGIDLEVMVPGETLDDGSSLVEGIRVTRSSVAKTLIGNSPLHHAEEKVLAAFDRILAIQGLGGFSLAGSPVVKARVVRQLHNVLSAIPLSYSYSLHPSIVEKAENFLMKRRFESNEKGLSGVKTICVSQHLVDLMLRTGLEKKENLYFVPNGVDTRGFHPMEVEKTYDLLFVGGYYWAKGLDLLLDALAKLHRGGLELSLGIVGKFDDRQKNRLLGSVPTTVVSKLSFLAVVPHGEMPTVINSARFVVIPSRYETFGLVAIEAMACGVPVIAGAVGGLPELVDDSVGLLVDSVDSDAWADAIRGATQRTDLIQRSKTNGPDRAKQYDWSRVVTRLTSVFG